MSEETLTAADEMDPLGLNIDLKGVDTSMPTLVDGMYILNIDSIAVVENKEKTGNNLLVIFKTAAPATSEKAAAAGRENDIAAGFPLRQYYPLQENQSKPDFDYTKNLAVLQDAVTGSTKDTRGKFMPSTYIGQQVMAKLKCSDDPDFGRQTNISRLSQIPR